MIECSPPLRSPTVAHLLLSSPYRFRANLVGCCIHSLIGGRLKPQRILFYFFFCLKIRWSKRLGGVLPHRHRPARRLSHIYPNDTADFRLVVASSHAAEAIKIGGPAALSFLIFFVAPFAT